MQDPEAGISFVRSRKKKRTSGIKAKGVGEAVGDIEHGTRGQTIKEFKCCHEPNEEARGQKGAWK